MHQKINKMLPISFALVLSALTSMPGLCSKSELIEGEGDQLEIGVESDNYKGAYFNISCQGLKNKRATLDITMFFDDDIKHDDAINHLRERASHMGINSNEEMTLCLNEKCMKKNWKLSDISGGFYLIIGRNISDSISSIKVLTDELPNGVNSNTHITKEQLSKICNSYHKVTGHW